MTIPVNVVLFLLLFRFSYSLTVIFFVLQSHTFPRTETTTITQSASLPRSVAALTDANCRDIPPPYLQHERKWDSTHLRPTPPLRPAFVLTMKDVSVP